MEETPNCGILTNDQRQSRQNTTTNLGTSKTQVEPITCRYGALTQDGSRSLFMLMSTSATLKTRNVSMSMPVKMTRVDKLESMEEQIMLTRDGRSSMLTKLIRLQPRDLIRNLVSKSIDHSILSPTCQCIELLNVLEPITWF
jgi:hypothetical protein